MGFCQVFLPLFNKISNSSILGSYIGEVQQKFFEGALGYKCYVGTCPYSINMLPWPGFTDERVSNHLPQIYNQYNIDIFQNLY